MEVYFTAETYFGSKSKMHERNFSSLEEMNERIVKSWNSVVSKDDKIFHLGNFFWDPLTGDEIVSSLNGEIYLIPGAFDKSINDMNESSMITMIPSRVSEVDVDGNLIIISHYPLLDWTGKDEGILQFYGYGKTKSDPSEGRINVSADLWDYCPISFNTLYLTAKEFQK